MPLQTVCTAKKGAVMSAFVNVQEAVAHGGSAEIAAWKGAKRGILGALSVLGRVQIRK